MKNGYIKRHIEKTIDYALSKSKVILLTGPRQVGKSFIMTNYYKNISYVTLDNENEYILANDDAMLFFKDKKLPLIIDEAQYAQKLFRQIKYIVDKENKKGLILLTGSQSYKMMEYITDSLAGRISIIEMNNLSLRELYDIKFYEPFVPSEKYIKNRKKTIKEYNDIWDNIFRGMYPGLDKDDKDVEWFYRNYVNSYIERDIREIINIKNELSFKKFLKSIAARTGSLLSYEDIADDIDVSVNTVKSWVSIIAQTGLIKIIYPYQNNILKRMIKTPKIYFLDTGLVCFLVGWRTKDQVMNGAMAGALYETFVVSEILKSHINNGMSVDNIYFYRDKEKKEIDLIIDDGDVIYPVEIKKTATIDRSWKIYNNYLKNIKNKIVKDIVVVSRVDEKYDFDGGVVLPLEYV